MSPAEYSGFRSGAGGRDVAAYLRRRFTSATLAELSERFGLGHPDRSSDMVKRARKLIESNREVRKRAKRAEKSLRSKPETRVCPHAKRSSPNWIQRVNEPLGEKELDAIRTCVNRGRPFGDEQWTDEVAEKHGLWFTMRPVGRPRKKRTPAK